MFVFKTRRRSVREQSDEDSLMAISSHIGEGDDGGVQVVSKQAFRIVLADDHPLILFALKQLILAEADFDLVGEAAGGLQALSLVRSANPDIAVIDVAMPEMNGIMLARKLSEERPKVRTVVLTAFEDEAHLRQALNVGVRGYVIKRAAAESLVPAIRAVIAGGTFVDPFVVNRLEAGRRSTVGRPRGLSDREREVLRLTALGHSTKEIAGQLAIGVKSVETYRSRAAEKLGLKSKADIVDFALTEGWLS
jgi:DNA-binding NarL/FixJ family response regulator